MSSLVVVGIGHFIGRYATVHSLGEEQSLHLQFAKPSRFPQVPRVSVVRRRRENRLLPPVRSRKTSQDVFSNPAGRIGLEMVSLPSLEENTMIVAYSRLQKILDEKRLSVAELHRRLQQQNQGVNIKSLYRLNDAQQPLTRLDLRVAGAICQLCDVTLADLVDFSGQGAKLAKLTADKQKRLDTLMDTNNQGKLSRKQQRELQDLVRETQEITLHNARVLAEQQRRLQQD
jgi:hypothetical protein